MADEHALYICGVYETRVILGRVSQLNQKRAETLIQRLPGPDGEQLHQWQCGTRVLIGDAFPQLIEDQDFDDADDAYQVNPKNQVEFDRRDIE